MSGLSRLKYMARATMARYLLASSELIGVSFSTGSKFSRGFDGLAVGARAYDDSLVEP